VPISAHPPRLAVRVPDVKLAAVAPAAVAVRAGTSRDAHASSPDLIDSSYAWMRLAVCLLIGSIGGIGMWSMVVALPAVQAEFGAARGEASVPYMLTQVGLAIGGIAMGRMADRLGVMRPVVFGALMLGLGYVLCAFATSLWQFALAQAVLIGLLGTSTTFGPLLADISHWFERRRGLAVAICASGNYLAGTVWPPLVQWGISTYGWRATHIGIGIVVVALMLPLALVLRRPSPVHAATGAAAAARLADAGMPKGALQALLVVAGLSCCVAMSMPQVHIVAYCGDLGYGAARGAEMLSLMMGFGIISRLASGWIADKIGGLATLLVGSVLQAVALALYLPFDGLTSLYVVSALFGLFQGGIVPSYAIIVREYFPAQEAGYRVGLMMTSTLAGMALGGWLTGFIFDLTGSYQSAFVHGIAWNVLNIAIAFLLIVRRPAGRRQAVVGV
jgi:MFS family permease